VRVPAPEVGYDGQSEASRSSPKPQEGLWCPVGWMRRDRAFHCHHPRQRKRLTLPLSESLASVPRLEAKVLREFPSWSRELACAKSQPSGM
jgi:hypothetical protein